MPNKNVFLMENHNQALLLWRKTGQKNRILVHIDRHFDFVNILDKDPAGLLEARSIADFKKMAKNNFFWNLSGRKKDALVHIGNYIYPAVKENIVREFYWIVPDSTFKNNRRIKLFKREIEDIVGFGAKENNKLNWQDNFFISNIGGVKLIISRLKDLPKLDQEVLLDIDVDYFIDNERPWLYPDTFIQKLKERGLSSDFITIAYSVEGGFTPIGYKFIGDHLAYLVNGHNRQVGDFNQAVILIKRALEAKEARLYHQAISLLKEAEDCYLSPLPLVKGRISYPGYAGVYYHLADLYYKIGSKDQARNYYQKAVSADSSYRTLYNNLGPLLEDKLKLKEAEAEYRKMLELDEDNFNSFYGLGSICRKQRKWNEAMLNYKKALVLLPDDAWTLRDIGYIQTQKNDLDNSLRNLTRVLGLKPDDSLTHSWLGLVYLKQGDYNQAMRHTRRAINLGLFTNITLRLRLVYIYFKKRLMLRMFDELKIVFIVSYFVLPGRIKDWLKF